MTEIAVTQRSPEWFSLRESVSLTASNFGNAIGVGIGKPYDYLQSLLVHSNPSSPAREEEDSPHARHGTETEPIIREAYELLTGQRTEESGFWLTRDTDPLFQVVGASPDAKVLDGSGAVIGLAEFKAPVYRMYREGPGVIHGIPRNYMAQIQGQMAVCDLPWCDFMAVCIKTKEIMLKRVFYQATYWRSVSNSLSSFSHVLQEARKRQTQGLEPLSFSAASRLKTRAPLPPSLPGEDLIQVKDLLQEKGGAFRTDSTRFWMTFNFLIGSP